MFYCNDCHAYVEDLEAVIDEDGNEVDYGCPECGSLDVDELTKCEDCGKQDTDVLYRALNAAYLCDACYYNEVNETRGSNNARD